VSSEKERVKTGDQSYQELPVKVLEVSGRYIGSVRSEGLEDISVPAHTATCTPTRVSCTLREETESAGKEGEAKLPHEDAVHNDGDVFIGYVQLLQLSRNLSKGQSTTIITHV
jgi:hypothetical protein